MLLDRELVLGFLPHRDPFLFIDTISEINVKMDATDIKELVGGTVIAQFFTRPDHSIFKGHFPEFPILPGVVQVEMMAQAGSFVIYHIAHNRDREAKLDVALLTIESAKFRKPVLPGMNLTIKTVCTKVRGPMMSFDCSLYNEDQLMSECSVMASVRF